MNVNITAGSASRRASKKISGAANTGDTTATGSAAKSKLGKIVGTVGNLAAKYGNLIPGVGGIVSTVGKLVSNNDPEWWQHVKGAGVTTNMPLSEAKLQAYVSGVSTDLTEQSVRSDVITYSERPAILEIGDGNPVDVSVDSMQSVMKPSEDHVSTFLMQEIRKVLNAVPLASVAAYRDVLINSVQAYALKKQLDKMIELTMNNKPFIPAVTDGSFPTLTGRNYATLCSLRDTLKEYINASVKLPHTLCQYLTWRYGRIFRMNHSEKAGIVLYNVVPMTISVDMLSTTVDNIVGFAASPKSYCGYDWISSDNEKPKALADMYNAYIDHVIDVPIDPLTQFSYDAKEFVLRTNLDAQPSSNQGTREVDLIYMDSQLDNATTFMASSISTATDKDPLFPVYGFTFYLVGKVPALTTSDYLPWRTDDTISWCPNNEPIRRLAGAYVAVTGVGAWVLTDTIEEYTYTQDMAKYFMYLAMLCKAADFYNVELYVPIRNYLDNDNTVWFYDMTAISLDLAKVDASVLRQTQTYAFANLVYVGVKNYAAKEGQMLAKEAPKVLAEVAAATTPKPDAAPTAPTILKSMQTV